MSNQSKSLRTLTQLALLLALEAVLAFTPLGFILIPPIAITILHIPVIIGGILMGYGSGAFLGAAFGVFSMIRAATSGNPGDILFNPFASGNPLASIVMAVLPRILLGLVAVWVYRRLKGRTTAMVAIGTAATCACLVHSLGVLGLLSVLFAAFPLREVFLMIVGVNGLVELAAAVVLSTAICQAVLAGRRKPGMV